MVTNFAIAPIQDRIICRRKAAEELHRSGLILQFNERDEAEVLIAGPGRKLPNGSRRPMPVKPWDTILFPKSRGQKFVYDDVEYLVLNEEHVTARVDVKGLLEPLNDYVLAKHAPADRQVGAILIPSVADDRDEATAIAVGRGKIREDGTVIPMQLRPGDRFVFNKRMAEHLRYCNEDLMAIREEFIVCITSRDPEPEAA